ncbi:PREDICTED: protein CBFA2T3-like, partial [Eurypyga helias]
MNGSSHSPTAINGAPSTPNGFSNGPATSSTASLSTHQLPPACGARQLSKLKRFLTTLQQFGNDISPEIGERVRTLVLGLVNSTLTIEEFHAKLQEATNFPLRPFVIPFLK